MISHFEYIGIIQTLRAKITSSVEKEIRHMDNAALKDQSDIYCEQESNSVMRERGCQDGLQYALKQVQKLDHETK